MQADTLDRIRLRDLSHATDELVKARAELAEILDNDLLGRNERDTALMEPVARLNFVCRYLQEVIAAYSRRTGRKKSKIVAPTEQWASKRA